MKVLRENTNPSTYRVHTKKSITNQIKSKIDQDKLLHEFLKSDITKRSFRLPFSNYVAFVGIGNLKSSEAASKKPPSENAKKTDVDKELPKHDKHKPHKTENKKGKSTKKHNEEKKINSAKLPAKSHRKKERSLSVVSMKEPSSGDAPKKSKTKKNFTYSTTTVSKYKPVFLQEKETRPAPRGILKQS